MKRLTLDQIPAALKNLGFVPGAGGEYRKASLEERKKAVESVNPVEAPGVVSRVEEPHLRKFLSRLRWRRLCAWLGFWAVLWGVGLLAWSWAAAAVYWAMLGVGAILAVKPRKE